VTYGLSLPQDWWSYLTFIDSNGGSFVNTRKAPSFF
jgi:hypothetical protein